MGERKSRVGGELGELADGLLPGLVGRDGQVESLRRERGAVALRRVVRPDSQPLASGP